MKRRVFFPVGAVLALALLFLCAAARAKSAKIALAGDSTVAPAGGWGDEFAKLLKPGVECVNLARGGRSSKSFRDEGHWQKVLDAKPGWVLIQFGHNDVPGKGPERETDPQTTFTENMRRYVNDVREAGAKPVLVTSIPRRIFDSSGKIAPDSLAPFVQAVRQLAESEKVPLLELHTRSVELLERLGPDAAAHWNRDGKDGTPRFDTTHLSPQGEKETAKLVADEIRRAVPELAALLAAPPQLTTIEYKRAGDEPLLLDICVPEATAPITGRGDFSRPSLLPVMIVIHGGGWASGDRRTDFQPVLETLTRGGYIYVSVDYRLSPKHRWPACREDVESAVAWTKAHVREHGGDPDQIGILGYSAGGHLAFWAAINDRPPHPLKALVGLAPATDFLEDFGRRGGPSKALQDLLGLAESEPLENVLLRLHQLSPINHLHPKLPPILLIHGTEDRTVPLQQSLNVQMKIRDNRWNIPCELHRIEGAPHRQSAWDRFGEDYKKKLLDWLGEQL